MSATIQRSFSLRRIQGRGGGSRQVLDAAPTPPPELSSSDEPHPLARRMAMAIRCQQLIQAGVVEDQASLADLCGLTRAAVTQVMHLNDLSPTIQETILHWRRSQKANSRAIAALARIRSWADQHEQWRQLFPVWRVSPQAT